MRFPTATVSHQHAVRKDFIEGGACWYANSMPDTEKRISATVMRKYCGNCQKIDILLGGSAVVPFLSSVSGVWVDCEDSASL